jgi:hypothetical protein
MRSTDDGGRKLAFYQEPQDLDPDVLRALLADMRAPRLCAAGEQAGDYPRGLGPRTLQTRKNTMHTNTTVPAVSLPSGRKPSSHVPETERRVQSIIAHTVRDGYMTPTECLRILGNTSAQVEDNVKAHAHMAHFLACIGALEDAQ